MSIIDNYAIIECNFRSVPPFLYTNLYGGPYQEFILLFTYDTLNNAIEGTGDIAVRKTRLENFELETFPI